MSAVHTFEPDPISLVVVASYYRPPREVAVMNKHARECLKRAAECTRIAEATSDPELQVYLMKLGSSWKQAATAERGERILEDQQRPLKTLNDLFW
jgi:hypothetical protein